MVEFIRLTFRIFETYKCSAEKEFFRNIVFYKRTPYNKFEKNLFKIGFVYS